MFKECDFGETNFSDAKLMGALFDHCVMALANFDNSDCREVFFNQSSLRKMQLQQG